MKTDRLFQIIYILLEKQNVTAPQLAEMLEVSVRTIYRDIDTLSASGIPIYTTAGNGGGVSLMQGYTLDKALLSEDEKNEILFALQSFKAVGQDVDKILTKLGTTFKKTGINWIEIDFSRWTEKNADTEKFDTLKQAILNKQFLKIEYCSSYGKHTQRLIKPARLVFKSREWYLQAFCLKSQAFRTFKIHRILSLEPNGEYFDDEFEDIPSIDVVDDVPNSINIRLKISQRLAFRAYDDFFPEEIEGQEDGTVIITARIPYDNWIYGYILSFGADIEILEPLFLNEEIKKYLENILKNFET